MNMSNIDFIDRYRNILLTYFVFKIFKIFKYLT